MPRPSKKTTKARSLRLPGTTVFSSTLIEDIESLEVDPTYIPDCEDKDSGDDKTVILSLTHPRDESENMETL